MRHRGMWIAAALTLAACKKSGGPWKIREVGDNGNISIERPGTSTFATLIDVDWPPELMPIAHDAAVEVKRLAAAAKKIEIVWETKDAWSGPARISLDGEDLAETVIARGLARPTRRADQRLRDADAQAWAAQAGAWSASGRAEILRWLRGRALALDVIGADVDIATWRDTAWQMAATYEAESLAFFDLSPGDDFGPPACVDRLAAAIAPTLRTPATVDDVTRAFAAGGALVGVPANGAARCEGWTVDGATLARRDADTAYTRSFVLVADAPKVVWTSYSERTTLHGAEGTSSGSGSGPSTVSGASDDALLIGGSPWFTSAVACERALKTTFPGGCEEP